MSAERAQGREAHIHDAPGRDVRGVWIYTNLKDAKLTVEERIQQPTLSATSHKSG